MKSMEECINGIIQQVEKRKNVEYDNVASVRQYNSAYHKCFHYMRYIDKHYPARINELLGLLDHPDIDVISLCAPMVLRLNNVTYEQRIKALDVIRNLTRDSRLSSVARYGFLLSLQQWEREHMQSN